MDTSIKPRTSRTLFAVCALLLILVCLHDNVGSMPLPARGPVRASDSNRRTPYKNIYRSLVDPFELYSNRPSVRAPVLAPRTTDNPSSAVTRNYVHMLRTNPAYISPSAGDAVDSVLARMRALLDRSHPAPTLAEQRSLLALFDDVARQATWDLQNPLHPNNIGAQHAVPIARLKSKYKEVIELLDAEGRLSKLTNHLNDADSDRFLNAFDLLNTEHTLLEIVGANHAARFPGL
ncbi:uncharacterized protein UMAG_03232 [Mycosarcoma maydis]|uniref:Uncharacterized protein n=1 Tax=Mycosarcoma maydis TaxID=5270 RepID=A0A0D1E252_MYCMD|nr:uncharacterized protein UMAG_03232 [Ustilago maydis 521]KIS68660.1 hypothetical protein UMAG_03232 [Ustilago maydis 521]|eukprot:XP_011389658.1 hypothetical protein UMAG_03232 [Ustilago maydis 521]